MGHSFPLIRTLLQNQGFPCLIDDIVNSDRVVYGVTTGFGSLCRVHISQDECSQLQENLIRTHSCGYGKPLSREVVRAAMTIRANALVKGYSGIRLSTLETLVAMINKGVHPYIPEKGSLGASGDLAPLAHMVLPCWVWAMRNTKHGNAR